MGKEITSVKRLCDACGGGGSTSRCCQAEIEDRRCYQCGKFAKEDYCCECDTLGYVEFKIDDIVEVFVCVYSTKEIKEKLYNSKKLGDSKTFEGKIVGFPDNWNAMVKIKRKKEPIKIELSDLTLS